MRRSLCQICVGNLTWFSLARQRTTEWTMRTADVREIAQQIYVQTEMPAYKAPLAHTYRTHAWTVAAAARALLNSDRKTETSFAYSKRLRLVPCGQRPTESFCTAGGVAGRAALGWGCCSLQQANTHSQYPSTVPSSYYKITTSIIELSSRMPMNYASSVRPVDLVFPRSRHLRNGRKLRLWPDESPLLVARPQSLAWIFSVGHSLIYSGYMISPSGTASAAAVAASSSSDYI